jgi:hypothetical protein
MLFEEENKRKPVFNGSPEYTKTVQAAQGLV